MARRMLFVLIVTAGALAVPAVPATAGGGCHSGVTTGTGDTVEMLDACFTPTTLRIEPGDEVTFVNLDPVTHNVGGNLWGHLDDMAEGDAFTATFSDAGIYPYACSYHPGMTGAVVVGDGSGPGNGEQVTVAAFEPPAASPEVEIRTVEAGSSGEGPSSAGWIAAGAIGLAAGLGAGLLLRRRPTGGATAP